MGAPEAAPTAARGGEPYVGLRAYDIADRLRFFGRQRESREVADLWLGNRLLVLHGPSGVGKTSLIQAGVLPEVQKEADVLPVGRISRESPVPAPASAGHNPYTFALLSSWSPEDPPARLHGRSIGGFLRSRPERKDRYGDPLPLLVVIDQLEGVFNDFPDRARYRRELFEELAAAVEELPRLRILMSVREDWLAALLPDEQTIAGHSHGRYRLLALTREAALEAVERPLDGTGRSFAPGVAEDLVTNLRTVRRTNSIGETTELVSERVEPVHLQVVCSGLWRGLPRDVPQITARNVRDYGDIERILGDFCSTAIAEVAAQHDRPEPELCRWLERTFVTELRTRGTVYEGLSETGGMPNRVAQALEDRHVLTVEWRSGSRWYELQHDRLIETIRRINGPWSVEDGVHEPKAADYLRAAESALADGDLALAEKRAEEALGACGPGDARTQAEAQSFLGNVVAQRDRPDDAERHYRRAAELFDALEDHIAVGRSLAALGGLLLDQGRYVDAVEEWQGAVRRLAGDLTAQIELARALSYSGQVGAALGVYGSVLDVAPESAEALAGRGQLLVDRGDPTAALADFDRLAALHPGRAAGPDVRSARAVALAELGRADEAADELSEALRDAPNHGTVLLRAARMARAAGDLADAAELARRAGAANGPRLLPHELAEAQRIAGR